MSAPREVWIGGDMASPHIGRKIWSPNKHIVSDGVHYLRADLVDALIEAGEEMRAVAWQIRYDGWDKAVKALREGK